MLTIFREASLDDIKQMQIIRQSVKENVLSNPALVTDKDYLEFLTTRGKGWVCEAENIIIGFSIVDLQENNIWTLFVNPEKEGNGIGRQLHDMMLNWYFSQTQKTVWLGTAPNSRAESFYRVAGWREVGKHGKGEIKFEMSFEEWQNRTSFVLKADDLLNRRLC